MTFRADYPGAIVVEARNYGYGVPNRPKTWCFHTPEERADDDPQTPGYLAGTAREASYTYFVSYLGFVFQLVPEREGPYANALIGKPAPPWSDGTNLNLQTLAVSFEGYAHNIHLTMLRGSPQWRAGVALVAHRTRALGLNLDWSIQHKDVSNQRSDCGRWDQAAFIADVKAKMEDNMPITPEEWDLIDQKIAALQVHVAARDVSLVGRDDSLQDYVEERDAHLAERDNNLQAALDAHEALPHSGGSSFTDADAVRAVKEKLA